MEFNHVSFHFRKSEKKSKKFAAELVREKAKEILKNIIV
jgi:hypothetical protein